MDLRWLLHPRTIAVVGATDRHDAYAGQTLLNLKAFGYRGEVWGVNPGRSEAHGVPCFPSLSDLPSPPDAVVVAIPAAGVPAVVDEAGELGCGGAVVYGARVRARRRGGRRTGGCRPSIGWQWSALEAARGWALGDAFDQKVERVASGPP
jgi:acetate---CoA ligase (ADP-forming)